MSRISLHAIAHQLYQFHTTFQDLKDVGRRNQVLSGETACEYLPTELYTSENQDNFLNPFRINYLGLLQNAEEIILKPLYFLSLYELHCVDKDGYPQNIHSVLRSGTCDILEFKESLGIKRGVKMAPSRQRCYVAFENFVKRAKEFPKKNSSSKPGIHSVLFDNDARNKGKYFFGERYVHPILLFVNAFLFSSKI